MTEVSRNDHSPCIVRPIRNNDRRKPADILFGRSGTHHCDSPKYQFGLSGTYCKNARKSHSADQEHQRPNPRVMRVIGYLLSQADYGIAIVGYLAFLRTQSLSIPFRSIRNIRIASRVEPFRSIRNSGLSDGRPTNRPIKNSFGTSGTVHRSIRYESSAYQEHFFGPSGTAP